MKMYNTPSSILGMLIKARIDVGATIPEDIIEETTFGYSNCSDNLDP